MSRAIKYVFVLYQENRSFDSYFGTFPGANGLYSQSPLLTPGYQQPIVNTDGTTSYITPFRIGRTQYAADIDDSNHSHASIVAKMNVGAGAQMNHFALVEEAGYTTGATPSLQAKQYGELTMAHMDCDTIPIYWSFAKNFTLYDGIHQEITGPSTPGNIAIFSAQSGITQLIKHPGEKVAGTGNSGPGLPVLNDANPFWGSAADTTPPGEKMPYNPGDGGTPQLNLTFANLALTLGGKAIGTVAAADRNPSVDLADVQNDLPYLETSGIANPVDWGWFEEGFDKETTDGSGPATHNSYITHHNGPQYFGYVSNNPIEQTHFHGMSDLYAALQSHLLNPNGGVYYVKGGYENLGGLTPVDPDPAVQANFIGDDDHPGYSDSQISEANVAAIVNAIASGPYWNQSAIVITWDDSEGQYDHVPPPLRYGLTGTGLVSDGPRVPLILISPYAKNGAVIHDLGDQASVVKLVDAIFNLTPLALLPDEEMARAQSYGNYRQNLGPNDGSTAGITNLTSAFDQGRLAGTKALIPASAAITPPGYISTLPYNSGYGCSTLGITPTDVALGIDNPPPVDFNPRPGTDPTSGGARTNWRTQNRRHHDADD